MSTITARIMYHKIKKFKAGFYCWVRPDHESTLKFSALRKVIPAPEGFSYENSTELHATVMYHAGSLPKKGKMPKDRKIGGKVIRVDAWFSHDMDRMILVAILQSKDLQQIHKEFIKEDFVHGFKDYTPHITIGKFGKGWPDAKEQGEALAKEMTELVTHTNFKIAFDPVLLGDSLE